MVGIVRIIIFPEGKTLIEIPVDGDIYENGQEIQKRLKEMFPEFNIRESGWETQVAPLFYELKASFKSEELENIKKKIEESLRNKQRR